MLLMKAAWEVAEEDVARTCMQNGPSPQPAANSNHPLTSLCEAYAVLRYSHVQTCMVSDVVFPDAEAATETCVLETLA